MKIKNYFIAGFILLGMASFLHAEEFPLSITTAEYPHMESIRDGAIKIPECRISYSTATLEELERRLEGGSAGDVIEVDFASYLKRFSKESTHDWVLVPVYLWREFPQHHIVIKPEFNIPHPEALMGKQLIVDRPSEALLLWAKGIGVSSMTVSSDPRVAEQEYFHETRIFPIMTVLAVRIELVKANPWLPEALFIAFSEAKGHALEAGTIPLPWGPEHRDETVSLMKKNYWSYGVKNNPKTLGALFRYAHEQAITQKELKPEDVFAAETLQLIDEKGAKN